MADKLSGSAIQPGTVRFPLSVNSSSTLSSKQLNFINTDSITVTITENSGNANVSFVFSGSGTPDYVLQSYGLI